MKENMSSVRKTATKIVDSFNAMLINNKIGIPTLSDEVGLSEDLVMSLTDKTEVILDDMYRRWKNNGHRVVYDVFSGGISTELVYTHDEAADIVDMFDDLLCEEEIKVPSPEDDEREPDNMVSLYGSTYSELLDSVEEELSALLIPRYTVEQTSDAFADPFIIRDNTIPEGQDGQYYDIAGIYQTFGSEEAAQKYADALNRSEHEAELVKKDYHKGVLRTSSLGVAHFVDLRDNKQRIRRGKDEVFFTVTYPKKGVTSSLYGYMTMTEDMKEIFNRLLHDYPENRHIEFIEWDNCINCVFEDGIYISSAAYAIDKDDFNRYISSMQEMQTLDDDGAGEGKLA